MTEAEWLTATDPEAMYRDILEPLRIARRPKHKRQLDLLAAACGRLLWHLMKDEGQRRAFEWLEDHAGHKYEYRAGRKHSAQSAEWQTEDAHSQAVKDGTDTDEHEAYCSAAHLAYDLWCHCFEEAFSVLVHFPETYPDALPVDPAPYLSSLLRDIFGNPFRPVTVNPSWLTSDVVALATGIYANRAFDRMPILADALQDAGCDNDDILNHCRQPGEHVRGCWVVDLVLGKQ